ncbi:MAG: hypothetical protein ACREHD_12005 [Pirellulales bacterium]
MSVAINLPPDVEHVVREHAARSGQDVTTFVLQAVEEKVAKAKAPDGAGSANEVESPLEKKFLALAAIWRYSAGPASSVTQLVAHPAYLQIIGLGRPVLPYLFRELARQPDHWFDALAAITGDDPIPMEAEGNISAMSDAWLTWGRSHGYL